LRGRWSGLVGGSRGSQGGPIRRWGLPAPGPWGVGRARRRSPRRCPSRRAPPGKIASSGQSRGRRRASGTPTALALRGRASVADRGHGRRSFSSSARTTRSPVVSGALGRCLRRRLAIVSSRVPPSAHRREAAESVRSGCAADKRVMAGLLPGSTGRWSGWQVGAARATAGWTRRFRSRRSHPPEVRGRCWPWSPLALALWLRRVRAASTLRRSARRRSPVVGRRLADPVALAGRHRGLRTLGAVAGSVKG
jgi:hypothetical protein